MNTKLWTTNPYDITSAAVYLKKGEVVAFPTETVYGLGANALDSSAVKKIFIAKGRPQDNPLIVHISSFSMLQDLVAEIPCHAQKLMDAFWPGALTLIFQKKASLISPVSAGLSTIAIRMPNHPIAQSLISEATIPIAAPSANVSGKPSCTKASHVFDDMNGKIAGIIDGGSTAIGLESTVVDCTVYPVIILRPGGITKKEIEQVVDVQSDSSFENEIKIPKAPGMKYRHYAPQAPFIIIPHDKNLLQKRIDFEQQQGKKVALMVTNDFSCITANFVILLGNRDDPETVAHRIFFALREFDEKSVDIIFTTEFPKNGIGEAIMNRLEKASLKK
ncbi:MAG: L-threonylcarbamoyladenylate synthase [Treponemataceae bacterium]